MKPLKLSAINFSIFTIILAVHLIQHWREKSTISELEPDSTITKCHQVMQTPMNATSFLAYSEALLLLKDYYKANKEFRDISDKKVEYYGHKCFAKLEKRLIPYLPKGTNIEDLVKTFVPGSRGAIIPSCDRFFDYTVNLIRGLYEFGFDLPITIVYAGNDDLSVSRQEYYHGMGVQTMDLLNYINNKVLKLNGWAIKPFAVLAAPYEQVMLMDAESLFLQNPQKMLDDVGYVETGLLLQRDRAIMFELYKQKLWMTYHLKQPFSEGIRNSQVYNGYSDHQVDSSFLIIDKKRHLFSLLATCKLNMAEERENFYEYFYGDKESFWLGAEMMEEPYSFLPFMPGIFGRMATDEKDMLCGRQLMFDREGEPFYFNEGAVWNKYIVDPNQREIMPLPTHYEYPGRWLEPDNKTRRCLFTKGIKVTPKLASQFRTLFSLYEHIPDVI